VCKGKFLKCRGNINIVSDARPVKTFSLFGAPRLISMQVNEVGGKRQMEITESLALLGLFFFCTAKATFRGRCSREGNCDGRARFFDDCQAGSYFYNSMADPGAFCIRFIGSALGSHKGADSICRIACIAENLRRNSRIRIHEA
jgi:hypothetical protein